MFSPRFIPCPHSQKRDSLSLSLSHNLEHSLLIYIAILISIDDNIYENKDIKFEGRRRRNKISLAPLRIHKNTICFPK